MLCTIDIGGRHEVKEQLALSRCRAVFCEGLDTHKLLHRTAFFLFLLFHYHHLHSKYCCVDIKFNGVFDAEVERAIIELKEDAGLINPDGVVTVNIMKALMSMDGEGYSVPLESSSSFSSNPLISFIRVRRQVSSPCQQTKPCPG